MHKQLTANGILAGTKLKEVTRICLLSIAAGSSAALLATSTVASAQQQSKWQTEDKDACKSSASSIEARIGACTALLSSDLPKKYVPYVFFNRGTAFQAERDYDRAIADYTDALRLRPDFAHAFYNRGLAHQIKGDYDRAITDYTEAIRSNPAYFRAYKNRGLAYKAKGDMSDANSDLNEASRLRPTKPQ